VSLSSSPGTAVMISHNGIRYTQSAQCFSALELPQGSKSEHHAAGLDLAKAREEIAGYFSGEWLFFVDDDALFQPDLVMRLLQRLDEYPDVDVISAFILRRWPPHYSVAARLNPNGTATVMHFHDGHGLARVDLTGLGGGAVIRRRAFERVKQPWFTGGMLTEDWTFCTRLKWAGGQAAVDLDVQVGHITPMSVWPTREEDGTWGVAWVPIRAASQEFTTQLATTAGSVLPAVLV
jgi:cellulose synthase/poly-beta-1,6-N-acetylglucosamine synthase-like glycosyltransferase